MSADTKRFPKGVKALSRTYRGDAWQATLSLVGATLYLGRFETVQQASQAYDRAKAYFYLVTGQADKFDQSHWWNDLAYARGLTKESCVIHFDEALKARLDSVAGHWVSAEKEQAAPRAASVTRNRLLQLVEKLEQRVARLEESVAKFAALSEPQPPSEGSAL